MTFGFLYTVKLSLLILLRVGRQVPESSCTLFESRLVDRLFTVGCLLSLFSQAFDQCPCQKVSPF